ncbi:hypothetical protein KSP40_PGU019609 [Platanthera guangdongensis]|uniref:Pre-rRNA-processing protein TSR2 homolog n=1 Tax=Platanthera guangdongensis TaxID=2320717 RepID=A0ABR2M4N2_9ASPA
MAMDSSSWRSTQNNSQVLSPEAVSFLEEGISLVLSRWTALQLAVHEGWGGQNSPQKLEELASGISCWFTHAKVLSFLKKDLSMEREQNLVFLAYDRFLRASRH